MTPAIVPDPKTGVSERRGLRRAWWAVLALAASLATPAPAAAQATPVRGIWSGTVTSVIRITGSSEWNMTGNFNSTAVLTVTRAPGFSNGEILELDGGQLVSGIGRGAITSVSATRDTGEGGCASWSYSGALPGIWMPVISFNDNYDPAPAHFAVYGVYEGDSWPRVGVVPCEGDPRTADGFIYVPQPEYSFFLPRYCAEPRGPWTPNFPIPSVPRLVETDAATGRLVMRRTVLFACEQTEWSGGSIEWTFNLVFTPASRPCVVPRLRDKTIPQARSTLRNRNCALGRVTRAYHRTVRRGIVIRQSRPVGTRLAGGARVSVVVSLGRRR